MVYLTLKSPNPWWLGIAESESMVYLTLQSPTPWWLDIAESDSWCILEIAWSPTPCVTEETAEFDFMMCWTPRSQNL